MTKPTQTKVISTPTAAPADARLAGLLAEQNHQYYDLDHDSACCPDGPRFACRNYLPHQGVAA